MGLVAPDRFGGHFIQRDQRTDCLQGKFGLVVMVIAADLDQGFFRLDQLPDLADRGTMKVTQRLQQIGQGIGAGFRLRHQP